MDGWIDELTYYLLFKKIQMMWIYLECSQISCGGSSSLCSKRLLKKGSRVCSITKTMRHLVYEFIWVWLYVWWSMKKNWANKKLPKSVSFDVFILCWLLLRSNSNSMDLKNILASNKLVSEINSIESLDKTIKYEM